MDGKQGVDLIVRVDRNHVVITGKVLSEPAKDQTIHSRRSKLLGSVLDRLPDQFPMQAVTYTASIAELPGNADSICTDVVIPGEIRHRIHENDVVQIYARADRGRGGGEGNVRYTAIRTQNSSRVVLNKDGEYVESVVAPDAAIPAGIIRVIPFIILAIVALLFLWLVNGGASAIGAAIASGFVALAGLALDLVGDGLVASGPAIVVCFGLYLLVRSVLTGRR